MAGRPLAEPQSETAPRDHGTCGSRSPSAGANGKPGRGLRRRALDDRLAECGSRWRQRVEDRLVAHRGAPSAGKSLGGRHQHGCQRRSVEGHGIVRARPGLEESGAVQGPGRSAHGCDEPVADGPKQIPRAGLVRHPSEHVVNRPKADNEVVPVVAIAEHRVEAGQPCRMAFDDDPATGHRRADRDGIEDVVDGRWGAHGRPSVGASPSSGNGRRRLIATRPTLHRIS
jgi:hypothetical protein